jgi:hypothetical protein
MARQFGRNALAIPVSQYRVLVTGSRHWSDRPFLWSVLDVAAAVSGLVVIHGKNPRGADAMAQDWCDVRGVPFEAYPADWALLGKAAGNARNQRMVDLGASVCYAFFWHGAVNAGTSDCMARAKAADIPVRDFWKGPGYEHREQT